MTAQLIDGNALSKQLRSEVAQRVQALKAKGLSRPEPIRRPLDAGVFLPERNALT